MLDPPVLTPADDAFGVLHGDPPVAALDEDDRADHGDDHDRQQEHDAQRPDLPGLHLIERGQDHRVRQVDDDAGEDQQRHAVADAALGDLLAQPHDEHRAGGQRQHGHQPEAPARVVHQRQTAGDASVVRSSQMAIAERLHERQHQRQVARVLGDLAAAELAFLRDPLEIRPHDRQQLQDDRRADVRHHAEREDRHARQVAAGEHVVEAEHRVVRLIGEQRQRFLVHARRRDVIARPGTRRAAPA